MDATTRTTQAIKQKALLNAIQLFGQRNQLAKAIGANVKQINNWLNRGDNMPYQYAVSIHLLTNGAVSVDQLIPEQKIANKLFQDYEQKKILRAKLMPINLIKVSGIQEKLNMNNTMINADPSLLSDEVTDKNVFRPIVIDQDYQIIAGYDRLVRQQQLNRRQISAKIIDLKTIIKNQSFLEIESLMMSERVFIGLALEQFIGNRQGLRTDLKLCDQLVSKLTQVNQESKKTRFIASSAIDFKPITYLKAKKVVLNGNRLLIYAMDQKILSIHKAFQLTNLSIKDQQTTLTKICPSLFNGTIQ